MRNPLTVAIPRVRNGKVNHLLEILNFIVEFSTRISNTVYYFLTERRNAMERIPDIILALISQMPWIAVIYSVHKVYENKPKHTTLSFADKFILESDR